MELGDIIDLAKSMGTILGLAFYVAIVIWTYKDARKRTDDPIMVATFTAISMLPVFGVLIYMLVRPSEYLADVRERELEIRAMERTLGKQERCPFCRSHIEGDYRSCPICMSKLRQACTGCDQPLDPRWAMCPYCETEVARGAATDTPGRGGSGGSGGMGRPATPPRSTKPAAPKREPKTTTTAAKPRKPAAPKSTPKRGGNGDGPAKRGDDIQTEPFAAANKRFVRGTDAGIQQPTMLTTPPTGGDFN
jgi:hypothetical protein